MDTPRHWYILPTAACLENKQDAVQQLVVGRHWFGPTGRRLGQVLSKPVVLRLAQKERSIAHWVVFPVCVGFQTECYPICLLAQEI